jgi:hypothetical protein
MCNFRHEVPLIKTVMSEVTRLYDLPQVPMIKTVISEVTRLYDLLQVLISAVLGLIRINV